MAEILAVAATYQPLYSLAWTVLTKAYTAYDGVQTRKEQLKCLLNRCRGLLIEFGKHLRGANDVDMKENLEVVTK